MFLSCTVCGKATKNVCPLCKIKYYCSFRCQKVDFKNHREECGRQKISAFDEEKNIPNQVFQTWSTKTLPPSMAQTRERLMKKNPSTTFYLYDDKECERFIAENFSEEVLMAFHALIPGAYKADLWRYCILYIKGGIYLDIKFDTMNDFYFANYLDREYFVLDQPYKINVTIQEDIDFINHSNFFQLFMKKNIWKSKFGIYNGFMICAKNNPYLKKCIDKIVFHTKTKYYGHNSLYPTGPGLLGEIYFEENFEEKFKRFCLFLSRQGQHILTKNSLILQIYPIYRYEQRRFGTKHYSDLWNEKKIYKTQIK